MSQQRIIDVFSCLIGAWCNLVCLEGASVRHEMKSRQGRNQELCHLLLEPNLGFFRTHAFAYLIVWLLKDTLHMLGRAHGGWQCLPQNSAPT